MACNCGACNKIIKINQHNMKCSKCSHYFHTTCANITDFKKISEEIKLNWTCFLCHPKNPNNNITNTQTNTLREPLPRSASSSPSDTTKDVSITDIVHEMRLIRETVGEIKSQMLSLTDHISKCNLRLDEFDTKLERQEVRIIMLENTMAEYKERLNSNAQAQLRNEVEIVGIPETPNENPAHTFRIITHKLGVPIEDSDLDFITRAGPPRKENNLNQSSRPLIARFLSRIKRDEFLKIGKMKQHSINASDMGLSATGHKNVNIYFNERLTQENRHLFRSARQQTKVCGYKYCWVKNGVVYIRKQEGNPAIAIKKHEDLNQLLNPLKSATNP
ncbi:unnamed protein product [Colias eurytheme]|nr:unnamed protein product [Colias eurytheme]